MIQEERVVHLNNNPAAEGDFVVYWMQASQRTEYNHALEYAIQKANDLEVPLIVFFGLTYSYPEANTRHYRFMLEGLSETKQRLQERNILFVIRPIAPDRGIADLAANASLVIADRGYLRIQKEWRERVASQISCLLTMVETDVVVPVEVASQKEEWSAATLRRKLKPHLDRFLVPLKERKVHHESTSLELETLPLASVDDLLLRLPLDRSVSPVETFIGGSSEAQRHLGVFLNERIDTYSEKRNDPNADALSNMSPYLHFGQISPLFIALKVKESGSPAAEAYLEELIVRRELSMNFVNFNPLYDSYEGLPAWARKTLKKHWGDRREYLYTLEELEAALTHDPYWNAAQMELVYSGKMHGYMRMYWGKKIIEWTKNPHIAFYSALYLNNRYELDGRDPNGFTGVAWCFGKHDRGWKERPIFGTIRYMNAKGLRRKFDADAYVERIRRLAQEFYESSPGHRSDSRNDSATVR